jgi:hypothetical protein
MLCNRNIHGDNWYAGVEVSDKKWVMSDDPWNLVKNKLTEKFCYSLYDDGKNKSRSIELQIFADKDKLIEYFNEESVEDCFAMACKYFEMLSLSTETAIAYEKMEELLDGIE